MRRRTLLLGSGACAALLATRAVAQAPPRRVAMLLPSTREFSQPQFDAFSARLRELGHIEGRDIVIEARWGDGSNDALPALARELVALDPAVIVTSTLAPATALRKETSTLAIVFIAIEDPDTLGLVASLARPGGNMTGITWRGAAMSAKLREAVRETFPAMRRVAVLVSDTPALHKGLPAARARSAKFGFVAEYFAVRLKRWD